MPSVSDTFNLIVDGVFPAMAVATTGGKVLIHQPFAGGRVASQGAPQSKAGNDFKFLNTNKDVVAL